MLFSYLPIIILLVGFCEISDETKTKKWEVFAFVLKSTPDIWMAFDWSRLTTIALVGFTDRDLIRFAHERGVKVVALANLPKNRLLNESYCRKWIKEQVRFAQMHNLDGINVDFEEPLINHSDESAAFTSLIGNLSDSFHTQLPNSEVSVDVPFAPDCIDGRCYDMKGIAKHADKLFVMGYDEQSQMRKEKQSFCTARANSPLEKTINGIRDYVRLGIEPKKLLLGLPFYGYIYPCLSLDHNVCRIKSVPFRGCNCSDAAGRQFQFSYISKLSGTSSQWDMKSQTPFFNYQSNRTQYQVWFDNPESISLKVQIAKATFAIGGVGMWTANFLNYSDDVKQTGEMWASLD